RPPVQERRITKLNRLLRKLTARRVGYKIEPRKSTHVRVPLTVVGVLCERSSRLYLYSNAFGRDRRNEIQVNITFDAAHNSSTLPSGLAEDEIREDLEVLCV